MPLSAKKRALLEQRRRQEALNVRSLDGRGYWMDANHETLARKYLETGDESLLESLPDYRKYREESNT